jgi:hypothetical protein
MCPRRRHGRQLETKLAAAVQSITDGIGGRRAGVVANRLNEPTSTNPAAFAGHLIDCVRFSRRQTLAKLQTPRPS